VSACNCIAGGSQIFGQFQFHLNRCFKRHRVQMFVKLGHQSHTVFPDDPSGFVTVFVILESVIYCEPCHSDINAGLQRITSRIQQRNRTMFRDSVVQQNHINVVVKRLFFLEPCRLPFQPAEKQ
jgi:hypothetical protein